MVFKLWSVWHYIYLLSPFVLFWVIYRLVKDRSDKVKYTVGAVMGALSIISLMLRNIDIFVRDGMDAEVIPLQVCHIGSIVTGLALLTKNKNLIMIGFCFNLIPAYLAMVFADALANYDTILKIRPQTYIWGHILIMTCALYGVLIHKPKCTVRDLKTSLIAIATLGVLAVVCNSAFRVAFAWEPNYFYLYSYEGTPLKFLYDVCPNLTIGWFTVNWFYAITLFAVFIVAFIGLFYLVQFLVKKYENK